MPSIEGWGIDTQLGGELWVSDVIPLQKCISPVVELMRQAILPFGLTCIRHGPDGCASTGGNLFANRTAAAISTAPISKEWAYLMVFPCVARLGYSETTPNIVLSPRHSLQYE